MVSVKRKSGDSSQSSRPTGESGEGAANDDANMSKKPRPSDDVEGSASTASTSAAAPSAAAASTAPTQDAAKNKLLSQVGVGSRIEVWWTGDKKYYPATLAARVGSHKYAVEYDDGDYHDLDLREERFRIMKGGPVLLPGSGLFIPDGVEPSELPNGWESIVQTELKACGLGADEEFRRQLEAYDSSDDEAGEPPSPPPTRKRMGYDRAAKHYKVTQAVAKVLVKIVDVNLERAGINAWRTNNFTVDDDNLIKELYEQELKVTGNGCVRKGFWGRVAEKHFAGRGLKASVIGDRFHNTVKGKMKSNSRAAEKAEASGSRRLRSSKSPSNATANAGTDEVPKASTFRSPSSSNFTDDEDRLIQELFEQELKETGNSSVRNGFWGEVAEEHFAGRGFTAKVIRDRNSRMRMEKKKVAATMGADNTFPNEKFVDADYKLMEELVAKELKESGSNRVRKGFWSDVLDKHFFGRGLTAKIIRDRHSARSTQNKLLDEEEEPSRSATFSCEDDQLLQRLVEEELRETEGEKVRPGFWERVRNRHFAGRDLDIKALATRCSYLKISGKEKSSAPSHCEHFTGDEDGIIIKEASEKLRESGERLPVGFWRIVVEEHSLNRTPTQLSKRWSYLRSKGKVDLSETSSGGSLSRKSDSEVAQEADCNGDSAKQKEAPGGIINNFSDEERQLMKRLVQEELQETGLLRVRPGFWESVLEKYFSHRNFTSKSLSKLFSKMKAQRESGDNQEAGSNNGNDPAATETNILSSISDTVPLTDDLIILPAYQATTVNYPPQSAVTYRPSSGKSEIVGRVMEVGIYPSHNDLYVYTISNDTGVQYERIPERFLASKSGEEVER